eukprot:4492366-Pyramimonas_sp.AAC.1
MGSSSEGTFLVRELSGCDVRHVRHHVLHERRRLELVVAEGPGPCGEFALVAAAAIATAAVLHPSSTCFLENS